MAGPHRVPPGPSVVAMEAPALVPRPGPRARGPLRPRLRDRPRAEPRPPAAPATGGVAPDDRGGDVGRRDRRRAVHRPRLRARPPAAGPPGAVERLQEGDR